MNAEIVTVMSGVALLAVFVLVDWHVRRKRARSVETVQPRVPWWLAAGVFAAVALFFFWEEHQAHIVTGLLWMILLACPVIHFFMHRKHGHHGGAGQGKGPG